MNMSKNIIFIILLLVLILPIKAEAKITQDISVTCKCINKSGVLDCKNSNCTSDIIQKKLEEKCGEGGTIGEITYKCNGYSGSTPEEACQKNNDSSSLGNSEKHLGVRGSTICNPGETVRVGANFCEDVQETARFLGYLIMFAKILVPFIIIIMGIIDLYKSVTSGKEDSFKKQITIFGKRILAGLIVFFIPAILNVSFTLISDWASLNTEYQTCATCLLDPGECE